jgi:lysophospholipase L1-like esterase
MPMLPKKTTLTILSFGILMAMTDLVPPLRDYKVMDWRTIPSVLDFIDRQPSTRPEADEEKRLRPETTAVERTQSSIEDPLHHMDFFHRALLRAAQPATTDTARILHYGDSPTTADLITSDVRALLQKMFGDAGHGFLLIAKPWAWYGHKGIEIKSSGWQVEPANESKNRDGIYGLGGVSFLGLPGAVSRLQWRDGTHKVIEVAYLRQPEGGQFQVESGDEQLGAVDTSSETETPSSGFAPFTLPEGAREVVIRVTSGKVRLFGVQLERATHGVIYHSLGVNGAYVSILARFFKEKHWREQLRHYRPNLVIVNYGTNESMYPKFVDAVSEKELREVVRRLKSALPETSILIMSPMDRGQLMSGGEIGTVPAIPRLVAIQQRVALETGCAFFNTFAAMGGVGTMGRWYEAEPRLVGADFIHPMPAGARIVGGLLYKAMLESYNKYKLRTLKNQPMVARN